MAQGRSRHLRRRRAGVLRAAHAGRLRQAGGPRDDWGRQRGPRQARDAQAQQREGARHPITHGPHGREADAMARRRHHQGHEARVRRGGHHSTLPQGRGGPVQRVLRPTESVRDVAHQVRGVQAAGPAARFLGPIDERR